MGFATGFATGFAKSVDEVLKKDILRTQTRMDGMEQYRVTRKRADNERKAKEGDDLAELLTSLAVFTDGDLDKAEQLFNYAGSNISSGNDLVKTLKENRDISKNFKLEDFTTFHNRARGDNVTVNDIAKNYIKNSKKLTSEQIEGAGLMKFFDKGNYGKQVDNKVDERVSSTEDTFGTFKQKSAILDHTKLIAFKENERKNRRAIGTNFESEYISLNNAASFATGEEKNKLIKQRNEMDAKIQEKSRNSKTGTKASSIFSKEGITKIIDDTITGNISSEYTTNIGDTVKIMMNGNEGPVFEQKNNGLKAISQRFKSVTPTSEPILFAAIAAEKQLQSKERLAYIGNQYQNYLASTRDDQSNVYEKYQTQDVTATAIPAPPSPIEDINLKFAYEKKELTKVAIKNSYPPGKVIEYKAPNGNVLKLIWTGQSLLQGKIK